MSTVAERIRQFNQSLLPEYAPLRYDAMRQNVFRFFRGTCAMFYEDLAARPALPASPVCWISGDLHVENFGSYKSDNRLVYFDLNDFDEAVLAPVGLEIVRLLTSILAACESLGIKKSEAAQYCKDMLGSYYHTLARGKAVYIEEAVADGIVQIFLKKVCTRHRKDLVKERTIWKDERIKLKIDNRRFFKLEKTFRKELSAHLQEWMGKENKLGPYEVVDAVFRVAGTGSLGQKRYAFLLQNRQRPEQYVLLDMKQGRTSSLANYIKIAQPAWENEAQRIVSIQTWMQNVPPALLYPYTTGNEWFVLRELQPTSDRINFTDLINKPEDFRSVLVDMGLLAASAQLRSVGRKGSCSVDQLIEFGMDNSRQKSLLDAAAGCFEKIQQEFKEYVTAHDEHFFD